MLLDRKLYKISENTFVNVQIILANHDIYLKMRDLKEIYNFLSNFFLEENPFTKLGFNYKLDSGLDIKMYFTISHIPNYITLNYRDEKCNACNVLPQMLIIKVVNKSLSIKGLNHSSRLNLIDTENSNLAKKLSINLEKSAAFNNILDKMPLVEKNLKDKLIPAKDKVLKSADKLFCNYLSKIDVDNKLEEQKNININDKNSVVNIIGDNCKDEYINTPCTDDKTKFSTNGGTLDIQIKCVSDISTNDTMNSEKVKKILSFVEYLRKNVVNFDEVLGSDKANIGESKSSKKVTSEYFLLNLANSDCNRGVVNDDTRNKLNIISKDDVPAVKPTVDMDSKSHLVFENWPIKNKVANIASENNICDKEFNADEISQIVNEENALNVQKTHSESSTQDKQDKRLVLVDSDLDTDFKPKATRPSKLSTKRSKRKLVDEQLNRSYNSKRAKEENDSKKFISSHDFISECTQKNNITSVDQPINFKATCISKDNYLKMDEPLVANAQTLDLKNEMSPSSVCFIDLTDELSTPKDEAKYSCTKRKLISSKSLSKLKNFKKFTFLKKKPIKFNISTPSKI